MIYLDSAATTFQKPAAVHRAVAQAPKLAPHREQMRGNIAAALGLPVSRVSVKATTEEGLGFTGSGEGIAAHAVALLERADN